jgi:transcription initiation factor TFIIF subunit beta
MDPKERRVRPDANAFIFSEQDLPGYRSRKFNFDDLDEDGNPSQAASRLWESYKRKQNAKKRKAERDADPDAGPPPPRRIPKRTAIHGSIGREFDIKPVKNAEYLRIEAEQTIERLRPKDKTEAFVYSDVNIEKRLEGASEQLQENMQASKRRGAEQKQARKDNQFARLDKPELQAILHSAFAKYRVWKTKDLRAETKQPQQYLESVLREMAILHQRGDFAGHWELKDEYKNMMRGDMQAQYEGEVAPDRDETEIPPDEVDTDH